ncbi:hypothetical protein NC651_003415 [Populus alba x Populus x berolinensis]|nr:hypothetical protein NC651_003415 [Populus alba x Populus x berolinensis]
MDTTINYTSLLAIEEGFVDEWCGVVNSAVIITTEALKAFTCNPKERRHNSATPVEEKEIHVTQDPRSRLIAC